MHECTDAGDRKRSKSENVTNMAGNQLVPIINGKLNLLIASLHQQTLQMTDNVNPVSETQNLMRCRNLTWKRL